MDTHNSQGATPLNQVHIHLQQADTHQRQAATLLRQAATLLQQAATPLRQVDTHPRLAVTLLQQVVTHQQQGATLHKPVVTLPQLEASLLKVEDTNHNLVQEVIPLCLQQVRISFTCRNICMCSLNVYGSLYIYIMFRGRNSVLTRSLCYVNIFFAGGGWGAAPGGYGAVH